jgi:hypothetical protein
LALQIAHSPKACPERSRRIEAARWHHDLLLRVDTAGDEVMLVDVEREVAFKGVALRRSPNS